MSSSFSCTCQNQFSVCVNSLTFWLNECAQKHTDRLYTQLNNAWRLTASQQPKMVTDKCTCSIHDITLSFDKFDFKVFTIWNLARIIQNFFVLNIPNHNNFCLHERVYDILCNFVCAANWLCDDENVVNKKKNKKQKLNNHLIFLY